MASNEHLALSSFIKEVHMKLRKEYRRSMDENGVWDKHCEDRDGLKAYAQAMHKLATKHWQKFCTNNPWGSRIDWIHNKCLDYFLGPTLKRNLEKDAKLCKEDRCDVGRNVHENVNERKLKMLDVGSCYNPFEEFQEFDVLAVDLSPAVDSVRQCDFLKLNVVDAWRDVSDRPPPSSSVRELLKESFDIVTFCLVLEYLPSPRQRLVCCKKAHRLLQTNGLLVIITPDSRHQHYNAGIMRQWKIALGLLGFSRVYYEKLPNLHAMAFRKLPSVHVAEIYLEKYLRKLGLAEKEVARDDLASLLSIPQDRVSVEEEEEEVEDVERKKKDRANECMGIVDNFCQLPWMLP